MSGDPTQMQRQPRQSRSAALPAWYVVTGGAESAFPIAPGLTLGETDDGALAVDGEGAGRWIELLFTDDGELWATIVTRDKSLRVDGAAFLRHRLEPGAAIQLPHNTLYISQDRNPPAPSGTVVEAVDRVIPHLLEDLVGPEWEETLAAVRQPHGGAPTIGTRESLEPLYRATPEPGSAHARRAHARRQVGHQRQGTMLAGLLGLAAGAVVGAVAVLMSTGTPQPTELATLEGGPVAPPGLPPASLPAAEDAFPAAVTTTTESVPADGGRTDTSASAWDAEQPGGTPSAEPSVQLPAQAPRPEATSRQADDRLPESDSAIAGAPTPDPGMNLESPPAVTQTLPPDGSPDGPTTASGTVPAINSEPASGSAPVTATPDEALATATDPAAVVPVDPPAAAPGATAAAPAPTTAAPPDPQFLAELEQVGVMAAAQAADLVSRRDLAAADLALAQGRLAGPASDTAHALYTRVLQADPESPRALSGLVAVRQGLINRAMAQLAGGLLDDARQTLEAAADAGADRTLIANLRSEVSYRQQLTGGQAE